MTQTPQWNPTPSQDPANPEGENAASFEPYVVQQTSSRPSKTIVIVLCAAAALMLVGWIATRGGADEAKAASAKVPMAQRTAEALATDASAAAAQELARRMYEGTPAERTAANRAVQEHKSARLTRTMAMAMALQAQKQANQRMVEMHRHMREAEEGAYAGRGSAYDSSPFAR